MREGEDQVAPEHQAPGIVGCQRRRIADDLEQRIGGALDIAVGRVEGLDRLQDEGQLYRVELHWQQAPAGAMFSYPAGPLLLHPGTAGGVIGEREHQVAAMRQRIVQANDPVVARVDLERIHKDPKPQGFEPFGQRQYPHLIRCGMGEKEVLFPVGRAALCGGPDTTLRARHRLPSVVVLSLDTAGLRSRKYVYSAV